MNSSDVLNVRFPAVGKEINFIECSLHYDLGGINYFTYEQEKRGYYVSVSPIMVKDRMISYVAFSGVKYCAVPCNRKCKSKEQTAREMFMETAKVLLDKVIVKTGVGTVDLDNPVWIKR